MRKGLLFAAALLLCAGCQKTDIKVLIGATTFVAPGAQPITDSVIVVAGRNIRSVGLRKDIPIPQDSQRTDLTGKWIVPVDGGRLAVNEAADLLVLDRAPNGILPADQADVSRKLKDGAWQSAR